MKAFVSKVVLFYILYQVKKTGHFFCISPSDLHVQCSIEYKFVVYITEEKHLLYKIVQYTFNKSAVFNRARISYTCNWNLIVMAVTMIGFNSIITGQYFQKKLCWENLYQYLKSVDKNVEKCFSVYGH